MKALHEAVLEPSILPTMGYLWRDMDLKQMVSDTENDSTHIQKETTWMPTFLLHTHVICPNIFIG